MSKEEWNYLVVILALMFGMSVFSSLMIARIDYKLLKFEHRFLRSLSNKQ